MPRYLMSAAMIAAALWSPQSPAVTPAAITAHAAALGAQFPGLLQIDITAARIADLPTGIGGQCSGGRILIAPDATAPLWIYRHEIGHIVWDQLSQADRRAVAKEIAATSHPGFLNGPSAPEVFADLFASITGGAVTNDLPQTQRIIRRRLYR